MKEYFLAGVRVVWLVYPLDRTVTVYSVPDESETLREGEVLDGGAVLPGFRLPLVKLFERVPREPVKKTGKRKPRR